MNYIVTRNPKFFQNIGDYNYCSIEEASKSLSSVKGIALDTETTGLDARKDKVFAIQIGTGKDNYLFDLQVYGGTINFPDTQGLTQSIEEVLPILENKHLVFHNSLFDLGFLFTAGFIPKPEYVWDTMIQSKTLNNGKPFLRNSLKEVMARELGVEVDKTEQKNIHRVKLSTKTAIEYCFKDVDRLLELHKVQFEKLKAYGGDVTYRIQRQCIVPLSYMEMCGLPLDPYLWRYKMEKDRMGLLQAEKNVVDYIWDHLPKYRSIVLDLFCQDRKLSCMLSSPTQMIPVFKDLGINVVVEDRDAHKKKGRKGETKAQKELRLAGKKESIEESVISLSGHEFVPIWLEYKNYQQRINTMGQNILDEIEDGRIYVKFEPIIDTSRIAAKKEGSMNSLNVPKDDNLKGEDKGLTRKCFKSKPGWKMVVADYSAQEAVILADKSLDPVMIASVVQGLDLHCAFARMAFPEIAELSDEEITEKHKDKRTAVKAPRFLLQYGGAAYTMHKQSGMDLEWCKYLEEKFKELHPDIYIWGDKELEKAIKQGYIESADNWRLYLPDYQEFKEMARKIDGISKETWTKYRIGKQEYKTKQEWEESGKEYEIKDEECYDVYMEFRSIVSKYFRKKGEYLRLSLNNPVQSTGACMVKYAWILLYNHIISRGHLWQAKLCNSIYDEIVLEVREDLAEEYKEVLGRVMREAGNYYLKSGILEIKADANIGDSWFEAK